MSYNTKAIDFTCCHPIIAKHLKRGESILCKVWDDEDNTRVEFIIGWDSSAKTYCYMGESSDNFAYAEPIQYNLYIRKASEIVKWLEDNGYECNESGIWINNDGITFSSDFLHRAGKEVTTVDTHSFPPEWFEER